MPRLLTALKAILNGMPYSIPNRRRRHSSIAQHQRHRKTLTPPFLQLDNVQSYPDWRKKRVPDMLWLSAMVDVHAGDWQATHRALDVLDEFVPQGEHGVWMDGRISTFSMLPRRSRGAARRALRAYAPEALIPEVGQALSFFPNCPAAWLFEDWAFETDHDAIAGITYLRGRMADLDYSRSKHASLVRMVALGRSMTHGKLALSPGLEVIPLMKRYPDVDDSEARQVEQFSRMTYDMQAMSQDKERFAGVRDEWCRVFWRGCDRLARSRNPAARGVKWS